MTFDDLQFIDQTWTFEIPVSGKVVHQILDNGIAFRAEQNERLEGYSEGKFVVEIHRGVQPAERFVLSPDEITNKLQELVA